MMAVYDWGTIIVKLPEEWRESKGKGVKFAIIDTGIQIYEPGMKLPSGKRFNATDPNFDPSPAGVQTTSINGDIDGSSNGHRHGTKLSSILIGQPFKESENEDSEEIGIRGLIPDAEFYFFKVMDDEEELKIDYFLNAIEAAINLDVDIICNSVLPSGQSNRSQQLFEKLNEKKILFFSTTMNSDKVANIDDLLFPSDNLYSILVGCLNDKALDDMITNNYKFKNKFFVLPEVDVKVYEYDNNSSAYSVESETAQSSHAVAIFSGVAALSLSFLRNTKNDMNYRDKYKLLDLITTTCVHPFVASDVIDANDIIFYHMDKNEAV